MTACCASQLSRPFGAGGYSVAQGDPVPPALAVVQQRSAAPRVRVPRTAKQGEVIEIKTLVSHPMETGYRRDVYGKLIPRHIIHTFTCTYNGQEVFRADWHPATAANPYLAFYTVATESGRLRFEWIDDGGTVYATEAEITVV